jgi:hypothetical protein
MAKPEGKRRLGKPMRKLQNNIKKEFQEMGWGHAFVDLSRHRGR